MTEEWTYIPDELKKAWDKLPDGWFKRGDVDIEPLVIEEMVINRLVYKEVMEYSRLGEQRTFEISYHKL